MADILYPKCERCGLSHGESYMICSPNLVTAADIFLTDQRCDRCGLRHDSTVICSPYAVTTADILSLNQKCDRCGLLHDHSVVCSPNLVTVTNFVSFNLKCEHCGGRHLVSEFCPLRPLTSSSLVISLDSPCIRCGQSHITVGSCPLSLPNPPRGLSLDSPCDRCGQSHSSLLICSYLAAPSSLENSRFSFMDKTMDSPYELRQADHQDTTEIEARLTKAEQQVVELIAERESLTDQIDDLRRTQATLKERVAEQQCRARATALFGSILKHGREATNQIGAMLHGARKDGLISEEELERVLASDLIWEGMSLISPKPVTLVVEVSWLVENNDVNRAVERAAVLRRLGINAVAVAVGENWDALTEKLALDCKAVIVHGGKVNKESWKSALT